MSIGAVSTPIGSGGSRNAAGVAEEHLANTAMSSASHVFPAAQARRAILRALGPWIRTAHSRRSVHSDEGRCSPPSWGPTRDHLECHGPRRPGSAQGRAVPAGPVAGSVYHLGFTTRYPRRADDRISASRWCLPRTSIRDRLPLPPCHGALAASTQMRMTPAESIHRRHHQRRYSLRRGHQAGSLEPGKLADFRHPRFGDYRELPYFSGGSRPGPYMCRG